MRDPHCDLGLAPAETALRLGMVNEVAPREQLRPRAWELAERIARMPDLSRLMAKQIIHRAASEAARS